MNGHGKKALAGKTMTKQYRSQKMIDITQGSHFVLFKTQDLLGDCVL